MVEKLEEALKILEKLGVKCSVSEDELLAYLNAPSYEDDKTSVDEILSSEYLLVHELAEICALKRLGYKIDREIFKKAYPDTYKAHLMALEIELKLAEEKQDSNWIVRRLKDLKSYLSDPFLPRELTKTVEELISRAERSLKRLQHSPANDRDRIEKANC